MASLVKEYKIEKLFGQIYTPNFIVCKILDALNYNNENMLGKKIIDPACGDGRFLIEVARRIIKYSNKNNLKENLECIYGWDIDNDAIIECKKNLDALIDMKIDWNIENIDSLTKKNAVTIFGNGNIYFDFIVGNPPYIRIQHLDLVQRQYIQSSYNFCKSGSTDIYIAFFELCISLLDDNGKCGLITPNTYFHTETARFLRNYFVENKNLMQITNYGDIQLFNNATTYSAITLFNKKSNKNFIYQKAITEDKFEEKNYNFSKLTEPFWQLTTNRTKEIRGIKLKDICDIHVGICTLCDAVYIFSTEQLDEKYIIANTKLKGKVKIEKDILKPIVKGSKLKHSSEKIKEYVLFPYKHINGKHQIIPENELKENYPLAYKYFLLVKPDLDKRDNGKPNAVAWYAFGRSQGLDTSFGEKIIFSPMNDKPNFVYFKDPDYTFYSGYCIKYRGKDIENILTQLNSNRMEQYVKISGRDFRNGWKAYNKKIIENFELIK